MDKFKGTGISYIGKFLDVSGSMKHKTVAPSDDWFNKRVAEAGLEIREVYNGDEDWITPFLTTLVPDQPVAVPLPAFRLFNTGNNGMTVSKSDASAVAGLIGVCCVVLLMVGMAVNHKVKRRIEYTRLG